MNINIQKNIPLAPLTTLKIGGPAKYFTKISSEKELIEAIQYAKKNKLEVFVLGGGSNILINDDGFNGLVIKNKSQESTIKILNQQLTVLVESWSGNSLAQLVKFSIKNSLTGLEWAAGIPGSVGGALRGNAGAYDNQIADNVEKIKTIDRLNGEIKIFKNKDCNFEYRNSIFKQKPNLIILSCVLKLNKSNKDEIEKKVKKIIQKRNDKLPKGFNAGSFFQNPVVNDQKLITQFEHDSQTQCHNNKIPAGWLIDEVGLRGKKIGGVAISKKHANFIINKGNAKAQEVIMLSSLIKTKVRDKLGVQLKEEVQYIGF